MQRVHDPVARYGGFSAAAKAVYRGQSRISEHVAELEKSLGVQLVDRTAHPRLGNADATDNCTPGTSIAARHLRG